MLFLTSFFFFFSGFNFDTEDGDKVLPGFLDAIIGIKSGETKSFPLVFPESWKQEDLRGVYAQFTVSSFLFLVVHIIVLQILNYFSDYCNLFILTHYFPSQTFVLFYVSRFSVRNYFIEIYLS